MDVKFHSLQIICSSKLKQFKLYSEHQNLLLNDETYFEALAPETPNIVKKSKVKNILLVLEFRVIRASLNLNKNSYRSENSKFAITYFGKICRKFFCLSG